MTNDPHPDWIAYAESESIRRLTLHLERVRERKRAEATQAEPEHASAVVELEGQGQVIDVTEPAPRRVVRIHHQHLRDSVYS